MGRRRVCTVLSSLFVAACLACNSSKSIQGPTPTPTPTPTPAPTPTPTLSRVTVGGNIQLTEVGGTAQLSAAALYSDSSTKDVTQDANWSSGDLSVVRVAAGLVTAVAFGQTVVSANYLGRSGSVTVKATPAGTFIVSGGVREPGQGWMANVEVVETISGRSTTTRSGGAFTFAAITTPTVRLAVRRDTYEPIEVEAPTNPNPSVDLAIQKIVRFAAGEKITPSSPLAENDLTYTVGTAKCDPCRMIRFVMPGPGTVRFQITWQGSRRLTLFAGGQVVESGTPLLADVPFNEAGEYILYLGSRAPDGIGGAGSASRITFTIETAVQ